MKCSATSQEAAFIILGRQIASGLRILATPSLIVESCNQTIDFIAYFVPYSFLLPKHATNTLKAPLYYAVLNLTDTL